MKNSLVFHRTLEFPVHQKKPGSRLLFSMEVSGGAVENLVLFEEKNSTLTLRVRGDLLNETIFEHVEKRVRKMLFLDMDPAAFFEKLANDEPLLKQISFPLNFRPVLFPTPFEAVIRSFIVRQLPPAIGTALVNNVREVCGIVPAGLVNSPPAFPGKYTLFAVSDKMLSIAGLTKNRITKIRIFISNLIKDKDPLEEIYLMKDPSIARRKLLQLPGIDPPTADFLLQRAYGFVDYYALNPIIRKSAATIYRLPPGSDDGVISRISEKYIPWRSWWSLLMEFAYHRKSII